MPRLTFAEYELIVEQLVWLLKQIPNSFLSTRDHDEISEFISVSEYNLALEDIAEALTRAKGPIADETCKVLKDVAAKLQEAENPFVVRVLKARSRFG